MVRVVFSLEGREHQGGERLAAAGCGAVGVGRRMRDQRERR